MSLDNGVSILTDAGAALKGILDTMPSGTGVFALGSVFYVADNTLVEAHAFEMAGAYCIDSEPAPIGSIERDRHTNMNIAATISAAIAGKKFITVNEPAS